MDNKLAILPMHVGMLYALYSLYLHVYIHVHSFCAKGFALQWSHYIMTSGFMFSTLCLII